MSQTTLSVARDFSKTPGARFVEDGPDSAEVFYAEKLKPTFERVLDEDGTLHVDLDGVAGYATSFLQGAFGTLAHDFGTAVVQQRLTWTNEDEPYLDPYIERYIREAHKVEKTDAVAA